MNIDWSKAPEGATHYYVGSPQPWRDCSGETWRWFSCAGEWEKSSQLSAHLMRHEVSGRLIPRPAGQSWTGEGLPPVGAFCEAEIYDGKGMLVWAESVIIHHHPHHDNSAAIAHGNGQLLAWASKFRPIRTPEQIAEEERKLQREQLAYLIAGYMGFDDPRETDTKLAAYIFDHDYRKKVAP